LEINRLGKERELFKPKTFVNPHSQIVNPKKSLKKAQISPKTPTFAARSEKTDKQFF
jgi:hypothetical protein